MKFIPYSCQTISDDDVEAVRSVLRSEFLTQGPAVATFEKAFAEEHGVAHAVSVSNATAGLHITCLALGVGPGDRVWTSPNSFVASANCAIHCGATVDFVDIDPHTRNLSVEALRAKLAAAERKEFLPKVVIPVDFAGLPCDLRELRALADRYGFFLIEDASHATGASYLGNPVGSEFAHATVFSFHAVKIITTAEGGIVATQDDQIAARLRLLRSHGITRNPAGMDNVPDGPWYYEQTALGFNFRLTDIQAALGNSQLRRLRELHAQRRALAESYNAMLRDLPLILPPSLPDRESSWHLYVVEIDETLTRAVRSKVFQALLEARIGVNVHYLPIHLQPYYKRLGFSKGSFPASEHYYSRALTLPLFPRMTPEQQAFVTSTLRRALD